MPIKRIGVLGAGLMGAGIAQVAATSGYEVTVVEVSDELIKKGLSGIEKSLAKFAEKGSITAGQKEAALARLRGSTEFEDVAETDIVIEAIVENLAI
jgi:3-hydroxybutyryl-CoA dehydrogenase